jgi:hypothetical protein
MLARGKKGTRVKKKKKIKKRLYILFIVHGMGKHFSTSGGFGPTHASSVNFVMICV